jgi:hypothetical protein
MTFFSPKAENQKAKGKLQKAKVNACLQCPFWLFIISVRRPKTIILGKSL